MDASAIREAFDHAVTAGCLAVSAALALACLALLARGACRWSARTARKVGAATLWMGGMTCHQMKVVRNDSGDIAPSPSVRTREQKDFSRRLLTI